MYQTIVLAIIANIASFTLGWTVAYRRRSVLRLLRMSVRVFNQQHCMYRPVPTNVLEEPDLEQLHHLSRASSSPGSFAERDAVCKHEARRDSDLPTLKVNTRRSPHSRTNDSISPIDPTEITNIDDLIEYIVTSDDLDAISASLQNYSPPTKNIRLIEADNEHNNTSTTSTSVPDLIADLDNVSDSGSDTTVISDSALDDGSIDAHIDHNDFLGILPPLERYKPELNTYLSSTVFNPNDDQDTITVTRDYETRTIVPKSIRLCDRQQEEKRSKHMPPSWTAPAHRCSCGLRASFCMTRMHKLEHPRVVALRLDWD